MTTVEIRGLLRTALDEKRITKAEIDAKTYHGFTNNFLKRPAVAAVANVHKLVALLDDRGLCVPTGRVTTGLWCVKSGHSETEILSSENASVAEWWQENEKKRLLAEIANSRKVISCTKGLDSYLLPVELNKASWQDHFQRLDATAETINAMLSTHLRYAHDSLVQREHNTRYHHQILASDELLRRSAAKNPDWLSTLRDNVINCDGLTEVACIPHYALQQLQSHLKAILKIAAWHKLMVIDQRKVIVWRTPEKWFHVTDYDTVQQIDNKISVAVETASKQRSFIDSLGRIQKDPTSPL